MNERNLLVDSLVVLVHFSRISMSGLRLFHPLHTLDKATRFFFKRIDSKEIREGEIDREDEDRGRLGFTRIYPCRLYRERTNDKLRRTENLLLLTK